MINFGLMKYFIIIRIYEDYLITLTPQEHHCVCLCLLITFPRRNIHSHEELMNDFYWIVWIQSVFVRWWKVCSIWQSEWQQNILLFCDLIRSDYSRDLWYGIFWNNSTFRLFIGDIRFVMVRGFPNTDHLLLALFNSPNALYLQQQHWRNYTQCIIISNNENIRTSRKRDCFFGCVCSKLATFNYVSRARSVPATNRLFDLCVNADLCLCF